MWLFYLILIIGIVYSVSKSNKKNSLPRQTNNPSPFQAEGQARNISEGVDQSIIDVSGPDRPIQYPPHNQYRPEVVKRLNLTGEDCQFVERLWGRNTHFLAIPQCQDETVKLYLFVIKSLIPYALSSQSSESVKTYIKKVFTEKPPTFFDSDFYQRGTQVFLNDLYKLAEAAMRNHYHHTRTLDVPHYLKELTNQVDSATICYLQMKIFQYLPEPARPETKRALSMLTPSAWKEELKTIKSAIEHTALYPEIEEQITQLIEVNEFNPQFPELCWEVAKIFPEYDRERTLLYYMLYKQATLANKRPVQQLPLSIKKTIFQENESLYYQFEAIDPEGSASEIAVKMNDLFKTKRKTITIDHQLVEEKKQLDYQVVSEINHLLAEEDPLPAESKIDSLEQIFENSNLELETIELSDLQKNFLKQFIEQNYSLSSETVNNFSQKNQIFPSTLINGINEAFYPIYQDSLILEEQNMYTIAQLYRSKVQDYGRTNI